MTIDCLLSDFFQNELDPFLDSLDYSNHTDEVDFINALARMSLNSVHRGNKSIEVTTKSIHKSPQIDYTIPTGENVRKEVADFVFDAVAKFPSEPTRRRAIIAQAKHDPDKSSWDVDMQQFFYIHHLPVFTISSPGTCHSFNFNPKYAGNRDYEYTDRTFAVGIFASEKEPFFLRTERIEEGFAGDADYHNDTMSFGLSRFGQVGGYDHIRAVLKNFLRGQYGTIVRGASEMERFIDLLEEIVDTAPKDYSQIGNEKLCTDGGEADERSGFVYVKFNFDFREAQEYEWNNVL